MMLVHKPQNIILASPAAYSHRRHPSAPVVVQPTRTPGLLSLSKPVKQSPHRQPPSQQRREPKPVPKVSKHASAVVRAQAPSAEPPKAAHGPSATPSPKAHAKQTSVPKETAQIHRSASHSSLRGKHGRQPSPPIITQIPLHQPSSQAEATSFPPIKSANLFDPFLDSPPPSPSLSRPSGKLARRRQLDSPPASPSPTKAIPVPVPAAQRTTPVNISRSDPVQSNMRPRPVPKRSSTYQDFPICDDLADAATKNYILTPPSTPRRLANGTRSAPLSSASTANGSTSTGFPFNLSIPAPLSTPVRGQRMHRRVPSEGVFTMVDLDIAPGQSGSILNSNVQALFALANKRASLPAASLSTPSFPRAPLALPPRSDDSSPSYDFMTREEQEKAGFFASSMFQNSPSPEDLPDPLLL